MLSFQTQHIFVEMKNQLDVTECFIALMICSTCFGHFCAHHQELETICVLLLPMVCSAWLLVVGGQAQGSRLCVRKEGCCTTAVEQHSFWPYSTSTTSSYLLSRECMHNQSSVTPCLPVQYLPLPPCLCQKGLHLYFVNILVYRNCLV